MRTLEEGTVLSELSNWMMEVFASFDLSDIFAFLGGVLFMVCYKNVRTIMWNRANPRLKNISLPKMNRKWLTNAFIVVAIVLSMLSTYQISEEQRALQVSTEKCMHEFVVQAKARADLNTKLNSLIVEDKAATNQFIVSIFTPPP